MIALYLGTKIKSKAISIFYCKGFSLKSQSLFYKLFIQKNLKS